MTFAGLCKKYESGQRLTSDEKDVLLAGLMRYREIIEGSIAPLDLEREIRRIAGQEKPQ
jgi:hypothetical protein